MTTRALDVPNSFIVSVRFLCERTRKNITYAVDEIFIDELQKFTHVLCLVIPANSYALRLHAPCGYTRLHVCTNGERK